MQLLKTVEPRRRISHRDSVIFVWYCVWFHPKWPVKAIPLPHDRPHGVRLMAPPIRISDNHHHPPSILSTTVKNRLFLTAHNSVAITTRTVTPCTLLSGGPRQLSRYSDSLWAGRPGIQSRWGRDFPHTPRPAQRPTQPSMRWASDLFRGGKAAGPWR
jgi:hypothetical protein